MLTTKNRARNLLKFFPVLALVWVVGCTERGPRSLLEGERLIQQGNYAEAIGKLTEAVDLLPQNTQAWNHLGLALQYAGQPAKAVDAYQNALRLDRNFAPAHFNLGCLLLETNFTAATDAFANYTRLNGKDVNGWLKLGTAQLRHGMRLTGNEKSRWLEVAKKNLEVSLKLSPTAEAWNELGMIEAVRGRHRDAIKQFNAALQMQPNYPPALLNLAIVYQSLNDRRAALQKYREYLAAQPRSPRFKQIEEMARTLDAEINPPVITNVVTKPVEKRNPTKPTAR